MFIVGDIPIRVQTTDGVQFIDYVFKRIDSIYERIQIQCIGIIGPRPPSEGTELTRQSADVRLGDVKIRIEEYLITVTSNLAHVRQMGNF